MNRVNHIMSLVVFLSCGHALADWNVTQHNNQIPNDGTFWSPDFNLRRIIIRNSIPLQSFRFSVSDTSDPAGLGTVEAIVPQTPTRLAVVTVEIWNPTGPPYAARDVKEISLHGSGENGFADVWLGHVRVAGHLGEFGIDPLHGVDANSSIIVGGNLLSSLRSDLNHATVIQIGGNVAVNQRIEAVGSIGSVTIGGNLSGIINGGTLGNVTINGAGPHTGNITVGGNYGGAMTVNGVMNGLVTFGSNFSGNLTVNGNMNGSISIGQTFSGTIDVNGDIADGTTNWVLIKRMVSPAHIECNNLGLRTYLGGDWLVIGHGLDLNGLRTTTHTGTVTINGVLSGRVYVRGFSALTMNVNTINATEDWNANGTHSWRDGGIEVTSGVCAAERGGRAGCGAPPTVT